MLKSTRKIRIPKKTNKKKTIAQLTYQSKLGCHDNITCIKNFTHQNMSEEKKWNSFWKYLRPQKMKDAKFKLMKFKEMWHPTSSHAHCMNGTCLLDEVVCVSKNILFNPSIFILFWFFFSGTSDGLKACSCYIFENNSSLTWRQAKDSCESNNKHLVVIETEKEWKFINNTLKNQITGENVYKDEWHIGLLLSLTTGNWTWVNGKPLTINKWQPSKPQKGNLYALIAKAFPPGHYGLFNSIIGNLQRAWICEEETGVNMI